MIHDKIEKLTTIIYITLDADKKGFKELDNQLHIKVNNDNFEEFFKAVFSKKELNKHEEIIIKEHLQTNDSLATNIIILDVEIKIVLSFHESAIEIDTLISVLETQALNLISFQNTCQMHVMKKNLSIDEFKESFNDEELASIYKVITEKTESLSIKEISDILKNEYFKYKKTGEYFNKKQMITTDSIYQLIKDNKKMLCKDNLSQLDKFLYIIEIHNIFKNNSSKINMKKATNKKTIRCKIKCPDNILNEIKSKFNIQTDEFEVINVNGIKTILSSKGMSMRRFCEITFSEIYKEMNYNHIVKTMSSTFNIETCIFELVIPKAFFDYIDIYQQEVAEYAYKNLDSLYEYVKDKLKVKVGQPKQG